MRDDEDFLACADAPANSTNHDSHGSTWSVWLGIVGIAGLVAIGCFAGDAGSLDDDYMDDPPPPGGCQTECPSPGSDTSPVGGPCTNSSDCEAGGWCSAQFDGEVQSFVCQDQCVPLMDDSQWCADDTACCEGTVCSGRGFCILPGETEGHDSGSDSGRGSTDGTSGSSTSTGSGSGTSSQGSTDASAGSTRGSSG